jgi:hypothetical protein
LLTSGIVVSRAIKRPHIWLGSRIEGMCLAANRLIAWLSFLKSLAISQLASL